MNKEISVSAKTSETTDIKLSSGKLAPLAHGAVFAEVGDTAVLATVATGKARPGTDFFPLTIDVEERMYAAGKIPGSFFRREGRPSELAILTCRLIDRPLRPAFPSDFREEVQVVLTVMGSDKENPYDVLALNAASAAISISGIPFEGPVGAVHLSYLNGEWVANGTYAQREESIFEIVVAGRKTTVDGKDDIAITMVEAGGNPNTVEKYESGVAKVTEEELAKALEFSKEWVKAAIDVQEELVKAHVKQNGEIKIREYSPSVDYTPEVFAKIEKTYSKQITAALDNDSKEQRDTDLKAVLADIIAAEVSEDSEAALESQIKKAYSSLQKKLMRAKIVNDNVRMDGRKLDEIRELSAEVSVLKSAHGTGLFQRGDTQVLSVATLAMPNMKQTLDTLATDVSKRYMHQYNFPPYSVGETGRVGSPKRREIGHGALAERALIPVLPSEEKWPYAMRVVSDVLASNGSSSQASVCGSTLALMDAGVPIAAPVAGIAMGLVYENDKYVTLTDIQGAEDAFGDMDFKVAGTSEYVTALQLDTKIDGIPSEVLAGALEQAKVARLAILDVINSVLKSPRSDVGENAPKITRIEIPGNKIGEIIGPKGKMINLIQENSGADIAVEEDDNGAFVIIGATGPESARIAAEAIEAIVNPPMPEVNKDYEGTVVSITKYGAFINIMPGTDGLVHISQLGAEGERVTNVEDHLKQDQKIEVTVMSIDDRGKISLTLKGKEKKNESVSSNRSNNRESSNRDSAKKDTRSASNNRDAKSNDDKKESSDSKDNRAKRKEVNFEDFFSSELEAEFGDLGSKDK